MRLRKWATPAPPLSLLRLRMGTPSCFENALSLGSKIRSLIPLGYLANLNLLEAQSVLVSGEKSLQKKSHLFHIAAICSVEPCSYGQGRKVAVGEGCDDNLTLRKNSVSEAIRGARGWDL